MNDSFKEAILQNEELAAEVKSILAELIPLFVRFNSALFSGATNTVIANELNASAALTSDLYHLAEALNVEQPKATAKKMKAALTKEEKQRKKDEISTEPTPLDPNNTPQHIEDLPEHAAQVVGEPTDSNKSDAQ